jgi:hypothetical protein
VSTELVKQLLRPPARLVLGCLGRMECLLLPDYQLRYSPTFIIGPPRSGTTLVLQLVTFAFPTCYFTNLASRFRVQHIYRPPVVFSAWLARQLRLTNQREENFRSDYGHTRGWGSPGDSAMIWQHWFSDGYYTGQGVLSPDQRQSLYNAVAWTEKIFDLPFVDKSTDNSVRIRALAEVFPTALFIQCVRSPLSTAQSLYIGRLTEIDDGRPQSHTTFTKPKEFESIRFNGLVKQSCELLYYLEQNIAEDKTTLPQDRFLTVDYKAVCTNPQQEVSRIADFMNNHGLPTKHIREVPPNFPYSHVRRVNLDTYQTMIDHLERLYGHTIERLDEPS